MPWRQIFAIVALCWLTACAETQFLVQAGKIWGQGDTADLPPDHIARDADGNPISWKLGKPYTIMGQTYAPKIDWDYAEMGEASWYGDEFHGRPTANGEEFNKYALTTAHRTLPLPSLVRVTNLENGKTAVLRVNDRGPFSRGRIIDVSHQAARVLGFEMEGTAKVKVELLTEDSQKLAAAHGADLSKFLAKDLAQSRATQDPIQKQYLANPKNSSIVPPLVQNQALPPAPRYYLQIGAFGKRENVDRLQEKLNSLGQVEISPLQQSGGTLYRVRLGPLPSRAAAEATGLAVEKMGLNRPAIMTE